MTAAPERINYRIYHRRCCTNRACFTCTLYTKRVVRARRYLAACFDHGQIIGAWHAVIHVRTISELAVLIIFCTFEQRLSNALNNSAMNLAFHDHRVDYITHIIDGNKTIHLLAGLNADQYAAEMRGQLAT